MPYLAATTVHGQQANGHVDLVQRLVAFLDRNNEHVASISIASGGAGYSVGDFVTVNGGSAVSGMSATLEVRAVAAGAVTQADIISMGVYTAALSGTLATTANTGGGSGLTVNATMGFNGYDIERSQADGIEWEFIVRGEGNDSLQQIFWGGRTYRNVTNDVYNVELFGLTGFNAGLAIDSQPGVTDVAGASTPEPYGSVDLPLTNSDISYHIYVNNQSVIIVCRVSTTYQTAYMGFGLPFGPLSLYPYPLAWAGMSEGGAGLRFSLNNINVSNFVAPASKASYCKWVDGNTHRIQYYGDNIGLERDYGRIFPFDPNPNLGTVVDGNYSNNGQFGDIASPSGWLRDMRDMGGDYPRLPIYTYFTDSFQSYAFQYDQCFWVPGFAINSEDIIEQDGIKYRLFQNASRVGSEFFFAVAEV